MRNTEENLIRCQKALAPTGISIAPYVINPYRGCEFGCIYCYSQMNKCFQKNKRRWGEFVDIKINCLEVLERELKNIRPEKVLLGSTTDIYQHIEEKHSLTRGIIELLNRNNIPVTILTKSKLILRDTGILNNAEICFTISFHNNNYLRVFESNSPAIEERLNVIKTLRENNIYTYVYVGPIIPGFTDVEKIMEACYGITDRIDFESFNYWMSPVKEIDKLVSGNGIFNSQENYNRYWEELREKIIELNKQYKYEINLYFHPYKSYWQKREYIGVH